MSASAKSPPPLEGKRGEERKSSVGGFEMSRGK